MSSLFSIDFVLFSSLYYSAEIFLILHLERV